MMGKLIVNLVILYGHFDIDVNNSGIVSIGIHKHFLIHPSICSIRMFSFVLVGLFHIFGGIFLVFVLLSTFVVTLITNILANIVIYA